MAKQVARHVINKTLHIVKYDNRTLWYTPLELIENGIQKLLRKKNKMMKERMWRNKLMKAILMSLASP